MPEQQTNLPPLVEDTLFDQINDIVDFTAKPEPFFPGDTVADLTPAQIEALNGIISTGGDVTQFVADARASNANLTDTGALFAGVDNIPGVTEFIDSTVRKSGEQLGEVILPQLRSGAILSGQFGGSRPQIGEALAADKVFKSGQDTISDFGLNLFGSLLDASGSALDRVPGLADASFTGGQGAFDAASVFKDQNQAEIDAERERFEFGRDEPLRDISRVLDVLGGGDLARSLVTQSGGDPDVLSQIIGGIQVLLGTETGAGIIGDIIKGIPGLFESIFGGAGEDPPATDPGAVGPPAPEPQAPISV